MTRRGEAAGAWAPEQAASFFDAYHKHGQDWAKVAEAVGGQGAEACEGLFRRQQAYLSIPKVLQSAQAFAALVENAQKEGSSAEASPGGSGMGQEAAAGGAAASGPKREQGEESGGSEEDEEEGEGLTLAASRARRTPRRASPLAGMASGRRTPVSGAKRARGGGRQEGGYEFYDDEGAGGVTESARKRRVARQRLEFAPGGSRRRHDADEAKGIDALLALAVAGEESALAGMGSEGEEGGAPPPRQRKPAKPRAPRRAAAAAEEWDEEEEEPADAGAVDDDAEDEDFAPPPRRTPYSTPAKAGRLPRPGSAHATPRRLGSRGGGGLPGASPGLGLRGLSPYLMAGLEGGDMLSDLGISELGYLTSPGFHNFAPGFVPSPQNPMPRLRRRKAAPERAAASLASPAKALFTRRSSLAAAPPFLAGFDYGGGGEEGGGGASAAAAQPQSAAEARLRRCLQQPRTQRWAAAEFCYSALDRPFFLFNPLSGLLAQLGLAEGARLTRREWSLLRSGLGKPRRLSLKFLREERARLEHWRQGCRQQCQPGAAAVADPQVADHLPLPLGVGQRVVARHPATRQLHDGSILTVGPDSYRVQFDRQELGVELVRDTDIMPAEPADNLPPALLAARTHAVLNGRQVINGQPVRQLAPRRQPAAAAGTPLAAPAPAALLPPSQPDGAAAAGPAQPARQEQQQQQQQQTRSADAQALAGLTVGLNKKEALLLQLRSMNDEAAAGMHTDGGGEGAPHFVNAYANVVLQLKEVNSGLQDQLELVDGLGGGGNGDTRQPQQQPGAGAAPGAVPQGPPPGQQAPEVFAAAALEQARRIIASCRGKLAQSAGGEAAAGAPPDAASQSPAAPADGAAARRAGGAGPAAGSAPGAALDWASGDGRRLGGLIESCVHSLVLLLHGAQAGDWLPAAALAAAVDGALVGAQPQAGSNRQLFQEIEEAVQGLRLQIRAAS